MPIPENVIARRNISVAPGNAEIPVYSGIQNIMFLGAAGKPGPKYNPPYLPNTPVSAGVVYLDVVDDGTEPLPVTPGARYICYLTKDGQYYVDEDTFPPLSIRHNYAGWPNPTE